MVRSVLLVSIFAVALARGAHAQEQAPASAPDYVTAPAPKPGLAPGLKTTELNAKTRNFQLVFSKGDEVVSGLAEFAAKNHLTVAHFTALGALGSAQIGWFDPEKRAYKTMRLNEEMEVTSLVGNITRDRNGSPVVHAHLVVSLLRNGAVYAGHLLEGHISITMQMYLEDSEPLSAN
jgi:predicted DNA-binding protein with PD1-like motif